jgi:hypothetical protein
LAWKILELETMRQLFWELLGDAVAVEDAASVVDYRARRNLARAAEFLVAFDVSRRGYDCFTVGEGLRYDLIADVGGLRRIRVKSTRRAEFCGVGSISASYAFGDEKTGALLDYLEDVDLFAFVAIDRRIALYVVPAQMRARSLHVTASKMTPDFSDLSWAQVMNAWRL